MGRPKLHDRHTAELLLHAAERIVESDGLAALTLRRLADDTGVSTRAVYSVFGSKDALIAALGGKAFDWLGDRLAAMPPTDDPVADLVAAGADAFRRLVIEHSALFQIGVQATWPDEICAAIAVSANAAWQHVMARMNRLADRDLLGGRTAQQAAVEFHAMCEGLAAMEARGLLRSMTGDADAAVVWREGLSALVSGFATTHAATPRRGRPVKC
jgi:AcrR family transcriptional regulator